MATDDTTNSLEHATKMMESLGMGTEELKKAFLELGPSLVGAMSNIQSIVDGLEDMKTKINDNSRLIYGCPRFQCLPHDNNS